MHRTHAIIDDFLASRDHLDLWEAFQRAQAAPASIRDWNRTYRVESGTLHDEAAQGQPAGPPQLRVLSETLFALVAHAAPPPIALGPWTGFTQSAWTYGQGAGLEWHSDTGWVAGYIYYMHPVWKASWGGELLVAAGDAPCDGGGAFVYPRPNRLVLLRGGTMHCIKKVERAAGRAVRASVAGFLFDTKV